MTGLTSRERIALLAIFVLAAVIRFAFWSELRGTALDRWQRFDQTDMATYIEQARRIEAGDVLQREPYHPYHTWQTVAPPAKWLEWYGPHSFHQAPAYSYLLALTKPAAGGDFALVKTLQLLLGAGSCALIFLIARHLAGIEAGMAAGALAALYGPLLFLEAQLLREGPALFFILAIVYGLLRHLSGERPTARRVLLASLALGAAVGAFAMFHEIASVLMLVLLLSLGVAHGKREGVRTAALAVGAALGGWLIGFAPLFARNVAVGAPPFSVSCRTVINFVESNVADAPDAGATFSPPGPTVVKVLDEAQGSGLAALAGVWRTYDGDVGRLLDNLRVKLLANGVSWEIPDNTSFEFFQDHASRLETTLSFAQLFPLGMAGMLAVLWGALRRKRSVPEPTRRERKQAQRQAEATAVEPERPDRTASHAVLLTLLLGLTAALSMVHTVARFRMYLVPIFIVYAGISIALVLGALGRKRLWTACAIVLLVYLAALSQRMIPSQSFERGVRPVDYMVAAKLAIESAKLDEARGYVAEARRQYPGDGSIPTMAGQEAEHAGQRELAIELYRRALEVDPNAAFARASLQRLKAN